MTKNLVEGWYTTKPIDKERYQQRDGLEGPFQTKAGKVVYYDPREGSYYDPDTDLYLSYDEWRELNEGCVYTVEYTSQSGKCVPMSHKTFEIFSEAVAFGKAGVAGGSYRSFEVYEQVAQVNEGLRAGVDFDLASKEYKGYVLGGEDDSDEDRRATLWGVYKALGNGTYQQVSSVKDPKSNGKYSVSAYSSGVPYEQFKWTVDNYLSAGQTVSESITGMKKAVIAMIKNGATKADVKKRYPQLQDSDVDGFFKTYKVDESFSSEMNKAAKKAHADAKEKSKKLGPVTSDTLKDINDKLGNNKKKVGEADGEATHWEVSYDHGPHQSNTVSVKAKSKEEALDKAKQVAKDVHKHNRITSIAVSPKKNESLSEAKSYVGRETKDGTWRVFKTGNAVAVAGPFKSAQEAQAWIKKQSVQEKVDEANTSYEKDMDHDKAVVIHGVKGVKSTPFRKKFKNMDAYSKWSDTEAASNYEVHDVVNEAYINTNTDAMQVLGNLRKISKSIELGQGSYSGNLASEYANDVWDVYNFIEDKTKGFQNIDNNAKDAIKAMMELRKVAKGMEREPGSGSNAQFANQIVNTLYPVMQYLDSIKEESAMNEDISQEAHHMQQDHEVQMARSDLYKTANYAIKLHSLLKGVSEAEGIEGWMQAKITKAADYLGSVFHALEYDMIEKSAPAMPTMESTQPVAEAMRLDRDNVIHADADAQQFAKHYRAGMAGDYRAGGPSDKDTANSEKFHTIYSSKDTRSGYAGSGTTVYTNRKTGEQFEVDRNPSGKGFYGTDHYIRAVSNLGEAVAKIACVKCDEVSTAAAWKKNNGFCPKCKTSSQGVAESSDYAKRRKAADDEYYGKKKPTPAAKAVAKTDYQKRRETNEAKEDTYMKQWYDYSEDFAMLELYVDGKLVDQWNDYFHSNETGNPLQKKFIDMAKKNGVDPIGLKVIDGEDGNEGVFTSSGLRWNSTEAKATLGGAVNRAEQSRQRAISKAKAWMKRTGKSAADAAKEFDLFKSDIAKLEETTAGGIAAVVMPLGKIQKRKK